MRILIVSSYCVIREGLAAILRENHNTTIQNDGKTVGEVMNNIKSDMADVLVLDIHRDNEDELNLVSWIIKSEIKIKLVILDFYGDCQLFTRALKCGVQGYIFGKSSEEEIMYAIDEIYKGKKYFDSYFVERIMSRKNI
ncbi:MAG: response regulator [Clostridium sp.]|nr:response regulator [Clostridium sp.]